MATAYRYDFTETEDTRQARYALPTYAVCNAGAGRWFWLVESHSWYWHGPEGNTYRRFSGERWPEIASGYAPDRDTALRLAREAAGPDGIEEQPGYAALVHKQRARARNMTRAAARNHDKASAAQPEYVYMIGGGWDSDHWHWMPYYVISRPILRKTARYIYVQNQHYDDPAIRVDRDVLEQTGEYQHRHRGWFRDLFYLTPPDVAAMNAAERRPGNHAGRAPATALDVLGLDIDATTSDIERAYRRLALTHHPDRGGDPDGFIGIQTAYEAAIAYARQGEGRAA